MFFIIVIIKLNNKIHQLFVKHYKHKYCILLEHAESFDIFQLTIWNTALSHHIKQSLKSYS